MLRVLDRARVYTTALSPNQASRPRGLTILRDLGRTSDSGSVHFSSPTSRAREVLVGIEGGGFVCVCVFEKNLILEAVRFMKYGYGYGFRRYALLIML